MSNLFFAPIPRLVRTREGLQRTRAPNRAASAQAPPALTEMQDAPHTESQRTGRRRPAVRRSTRPTTGEPAPQNWSFRPRTWLSTNRSAALRGKFSPPEKGSLPPHGLHRRLLLRRGLLLHGAAVLHGHCLLLPLTYALRMLFAFMPLRIALRFAFAIGRRACRSLRLK